MATEIQQLSDLISSSVAALLHGCQVNNTPFPDPNQPFTPESEAFRSYQAVADATNIIAAAAIQLAERVLPPHMCVMNIASAHAKSAALHTALGLNVTEILREKGPEGMHVDEIAAVCDVDSNKLGRLLRFLANNQCYREVTPNVFANTRISSILDTGKPVSELIQNPDNKHEGTLGFVAYTEQVTGDASKISSCLYENLKDPKTARSQEPTHAAFNRAYNVDITLYSWYELPEQSYRRRRFAVAMQGIAQMQPPDILDDVLDWKALPGGSIVVDVGGGIGTASVAVSRNNEHLKFVVQDFQAVCDGGIEHWSKEDPDIISSGRLAFMPHNIFEPQPITNAAVFILKQILHNWSDTYSLKILKALRTAARPDTKLIIVDNILVHACHDPSTELNAGYHEAPAPLLPNYGGANMMPYNLDIGMMLLFNSQERTLGHLATLLESTGWKIVGTKRHDPPSNFYEPVIVAPI